MPSLFVANVTRQLHIFAYRHPKIGAGKLQEDEIRGGTQIRIEHADLDVLESIVDCYRKHGLREAGEASRVPDFSGLCFQFEKPISEKWLRDALKRRELTEDQRSQRMREVSAVAIDDAMQDAARQVGLPAPAVEMKTEEQPEKNAERSNDPVAVTVKTNRKQKEARRTAEAA